MSTVEMDFTLQYIFEEMYKRELKLNIWIVGSNREFEHPNLVEIPSVECYKCRSETYYLSNSVQLPNIICKKCCIITYNCLLCNNFEEVNKYDVFHNIFLCKNCNNRNIKLFNDKIKYLDDITKDEICRDIFTTSYIGIPLFFLDEKSKL